MIRSMTGYSRVRSEVGDFALSLSAKTTNHRFLDLQLRLPSALEPLDPLLRRLVKDRIARGHVEIAVNVERAGSAGLQLNRKMLEAYVNACRQVRKELGGNVEPDPVSFLRIPGMVAAGNGEFSAEELEQLQKAVESLGGQTLGALNEMRDREGEALERDIRGRLERLAKLRRDVEKLASSLPRAYQRRLESRVKELLGSVELDPARVAQEVAYLASRADIAEELTRFASHLDQAQRLLGSAGATEVGKKLDFLLQELNREANTLLSKTTDVPEVGLEIARQAIEMKTEIEKLREQAQNVE